MICKKFIFKTKNELFDELHKLNISVPYSENTGLLAESVAIGGRRAANRIAIQPMEGCDATADGKPGELTVRRYLRFAQSGAGLIWAEATAVVPEGRANPRQLLICRKNIDSFKRLICQMKELCMKSNGFEPMIICQLTHSGRYSKPNGYPEPLIAYNNPIFEKDAPIDKSRILSDDYLQALEEKYAQAAQMAEECGFDGADIKCCHRYLLSELCSAYERDGKYGGTFENRTRLVTNAVKNARDAVSADFIITSRLNVYDGFAYPYGFGVKNDGSITPDLTEPKNLIDKLHRGLNMPMINISIGNPYVNSFINRPADNQPELPEPPLVGVARMFNCIAEVKKSFPDLVTVSSGHSYIRSFAPFLAAGAIEQSVSDIAGFGREAFAYPDFAKDMLNGRFDGNKCCIACGNCTKMMRAGTVAGCIVRDAQVYMPYYKQFCMKGGDEK